MEYEGGREGSVINLDEDAQQAGPLFYVHELHFYGIRSRPDHCYRELATDLWNTQQAGPLFYVHELHINGIRSRLDFCFPCTNFKRYAAGQTIQFFVHQLQSFKTCGRLDPLFYVHQLYKLTEYAAYRIINLLLLATDLWFNAANRTSVVSVATQADPLCLALALNLVCASAIVLYVVDQSIEFLRVVYTCLYQIVIFFIICNNAKI